MEEAFELYINLRTSEYKRTPMKIKKCSKCYKILTDHWSDNKVYSLISLNHNLSSGPLKFVVHYELKDEDKIIDLAQKWLEDKRNQFETLLETTKNLEAVVDIDRETKVFEKE